MVRIKLSDSLVANVMKLAPLCCAVLVSIFSTRLNAHFMTLFVCSSKQSKTNWSFMVEVMLRSIWLLLAINWQKQLKEKKHSPLKHMPEP